MRYDADRHFGCRVTEYGWRGHRLIVLENELLRLGVVASKGADVVELRYKPMDVDFLWHSPHPLLPPAEYVPTSAAPLGAFFDYYPGGWQESLPPGNGAPTYAGAPLGLHGEVTTMPWDARVFPYLWSWQVYGGAWGYPYYGRTYHVAIEPFNTPIGTLEDAVREGTGGRLGPGERLATTLHAGAIVDAQPFTGFGRARAARPGREGSA